MPVVRRLLGSLLVLLAMVCLAAPASAATTIDFEGLAPGTDLLAATLPGIQFRNAATSGRPDLGNTPAAVATVASTRAATADCALPLPLRGRAALTGTSCTLYATFSSLHGAVSTVVALTQSTGPRTVTLTAWDASGAQVGQAQTSIGFANFFVALSVTRPAQTIAAISITSTAALAGGLLAADDLVFDDSVAPPSISLAVGAGKLSGLPGKAATGTLQVQRFGGASGPVTIAISSPSGATPVVVAPNPVTGAAATLSTTIAANAPPGTQTLTVTATWAGGAIAPLSVPLEVRAPYRLIPQPTTAVSGCGTTTIHNQLVVDPAFTDPITVSVSSPRSTLPVVLDGPATLPTSPYPLEVPLLARVLPGDPPTPATVHVQLSSPGLPARTFAIAISRGGFGGRIDGLELTQGAQSQLVAQPGGPNPTVPYAGVPLIQGRRTALRIFASSALSAPVPGVLARVSAYRGSQLFGQAWAYGLRDLQPSPPRPVATARLAGSEFELIVPTSWLFQKSLELRAQLVPGGADQCDPSAALSTLGISGVSFGFRGGAAVVPVMVTAPKHEMTAPPGEQFVFGRAARALPIGLDSDYYLWNQVNVDDAIDARYAGVNGNDAAAVSKARGKVSHAAVAAVDEAISDEGIAIHSRTFYVGVSGPYRFMPGPKGIQDAGLWVGDPLGHDTAVVNWQRPFDSVAHEFGHFTGLAHADTACGGDRGILNASWGDQYGSLLSYGYDVSQAPGGTVYTPSDVDLMSYCLGRNNPVNNGARPWGSARLWQEMGADWLKPAVVGVDRGRAATTVRRVRAIISDGDTEVVSTRLAQAGAPLGGAAPGYEIRLVNGAGGTVATAPAMLRAGHDDGDQARGVPATGVGLLVADLPAAANGARLELARAGVAVATLNRSAAAPRIRLLRVTGRGTLKVRWAATDADGGAVRVRVDLSTDRGRTFRQISSGPNTGRVAIPTYALPASRRAMVRLTATDGWNETAVRSGLFALTSAARVWIDTPAAGARRPADAPLVLSGGAILGGRLAKPAALTWLDGGRVLGHGRDLVANGLRVGTHRIRLAVRGSRSTATVRVRIVTAKPAFRTVRAPATVKRSARSVRIAIAATFPVRLVLGRRTVAVGTKLRTVKVPIAAGRRPFRLRLTLRAPGGRTSTATVVIGRR